jgi:hypothetical protein
MDEYVFARFSLDEPVAFVVVEPLDGTNLGHSPPPAGNSRPSFDDFARSSRAAVMKSCNVLA